MEIPRDKYFWLPVVFSLFMAGAALAPGLNLQIIAAENKNQQSNDAFGILAASTLSEMFASIMNWPEIQALNNRVAQMTDLTTPAQVFEAVKMLGPSDKDNTALLYKLANLISVSKEHDFEFLTIVCDNRVTAAIDSGKLLDKNNKPIPICGKLPPKVEAIVLHFPISSELTNTRVRVVEKCNDIYRACIVSGIDFGSMCAGIDKMERTNNNSNKLFGGYPSICLASGNRKNENINCITFLDLQGWTNLKKPENPLDMGKGWKGWKENEGAGIILAKQLQTN